MPKVIVNLADTHIRSVINSHKKLLTKVQIKLADGKGLFFIVDKNGSVYWRWDYARPMTKKRNSISLGTYLEVSLLSARAKRTEYRELLTQNIDPSTHNVFSYAKKNRPYLSRRVVAVHLVYVSIGYGA